MDAVKMVFKARDEEERGKEGRRKTHQASPSQRTRCSFPLLSAASKNAFQTHDGGGGGHLPGWLPILLIVLCRNKIS